MIRCACCWCPRNPLIRAWRKETNFASASALSDPFISPKSLAKDFDALLAWLLSASATSGKALVTVQSSALEWTLPGKHPLLLIGNSSGSLGYPPRGSPLGLAVGTNYLSGAFVMWRDPVKSCLGSEMKGAATAVALSTLASSA